MSLLLALGVLLFSSGAQAAPPDLRLALAAGAPRIERIDPSFTAVETDDPAVIHGELLPSAELLLEPKGKGTAHVFLFAERLVRVIEVAVAVELPPSEPPPAPPCEKPRIKPACVAAWRARLLHLDARDAPPLELELEAMQEEVKQAQAALEKAGLGKLQLSASPFGVKLKGAADAAEERRGLEAIWPWMLGPLRIDR